MTNFICNSKMLNPSKKFIAFPLMSRSSMVEIDHIPIHLSTLIIIIYIYM